MKTITRRTAITTAVAALATPALAQPDPATKPRNANGDWHLGPPLPFAVQEIYPALHDGQIHLAGGFISQGGSISGATDRHIALDPETSAWFDVSRLPVPRHHPNLVSFDGQLVSIGGFEVHSPQSVWVMQAGVWSFDRQEWRDAPSLPQPSGECVCDVIADHLHVCGGRTPVSDANANWQDHGDVADHFVLNGLGGTWETAAPLPMARNSAAGALIERNWHIVGGRTVSDGNTSQHDVYDAREDRWRSASPLPQAQGGLAAASIGNALFAFGGEYFNEGGGVYAEAYRYDPISDTWDALPDMPHPRHGLGAVTLASEIYVIGGALEVGGNQTSEIVEIFTP